VKGERTEPYHRTVEPVRGLRAEVLEGPDAGKNHDAGIDALTIGTEPGNSLVLTDPTVSRYHIELLRQHDRIVLKDLGSTNGTWVGTTWLKEATIAPGTVVRLGRTAIKVGDGAHGTVELLDRDGLGGLRGRSSVMRTLMARVERAAQSDATVLLTGETGTGKELIARAIHLEGRRSDAPFETVDCGALMPTLVASDLFGHEKGAFTGADQQHLGAFERAHGGTVFLDEIGELPHAVQTALLGVLERRSFKRLGGQRSVEVDVRVVSATHRDLRSEVNAGTFREDLYYRLAIVNLRVPSLRERIGDLSLLIEYFLRESGYEGALDAMFPPAVMEALRTHRWPGNIRELRNFVESSLAMGEHPALEGSKVHASQAFPSLELDALFARPYGEARALVVEEFERLYLSALLERSNGNVSRAAKESGINRSHLTQMLKRHPRRARKDESG
jgi:DNA-binding NtrC family response regulator